MANRLNAPPTNRSKKLKTLPGCRNNRSRAATLTPGTGRCAPNRYKTSMAAVKSTRRRRSAMRSALISPASILDHLGATARFLDRRHRSLAERMRLDRQGAVQRARPQDFHPPAPDETGRAQLTRRHLAVGGKLVQGFQVHRSGFHPGEPARMADAAGAHSSPEGQPLGQNGLAAFKPRTLAPSRTGGLTFPPAAAVGAATRTQAPADAPAPTARPSSRLERIDFQHDRCLVFRSIVSIAPDP